MVSSRLRMAGGEGGGGGEGRRERDPVTYSIIFLRVEGIVV